MRHILGGLIAATAIVAMAPAAQATIFTPADTGNFKVTGGNPMTGDNTVTATFNDTITTIGTFSDSFEFTIGGNGLGSGSVTTIASLFKSPTNLDLNTITVNGTMVAIAKTANGLYESAGISGFPIVAGALNTITIDGYSRGNGSFSGTATFDPTPSVPELATWGMMILGFGVVGSAMRRQRSSAAGYQKGSTNVSFA